MGFVKVEVSLDISGKKAVHYLNKDNILFIRPDIKNAEQWQVMMKGQLYFFVDEAGKEKLLEAQ